METEARPDLSCYSSIFFLILSYENKETCGFNAESKGKQKCVQLIYLLIS